ncbi:glycosyltransferase family 2 protein [Labrys monachus]|uniref:Glycosyltransferase 2-like domain-containing protein n=1 Tax=Labrys monachus TaxID=217067 RepID=A0ABU0FC52_9HYPH|nr:glycosyltransferase family 2 protein [Labrys monachus]MDQ0392011.1 hypothetical protein [Labrys monachus]
MTGRVRVSAAMIVRNEERFLAGCLESLSGRVEEIVVVDTGSSDDTVGIAGRTPGVRLLHHRWNDDFAAARNVALDAASGDWILYIDADERLGLPKGGVVADYIDPGAVAGFVRFRPKTGYTRYREWRLFRSDPRIRFAGKIHETIKPAVRLLSAREGLPIVRTEVELDHIGYDGDQSHKHGRNLALLEIAVRADPDRVYCWHHMAETLAALGRVQEAVAAAREGLARADRDLSNDQRAPASLIVQFLARIEAELGGDPLDVIEAGLARMPDDHALWFLRGQALLRAGRPGEALEMAERLQAIDPEDLCDGLLAYDRAIFREKACELAALACLRLGRRREAAAQFAAAARLAPGDAAYRIKAIALNGPARVAP